ncbi:MAG: HD domain-containing protein, partial [Candidatus Poribacteria bacterium]
MKLLSHRILAALPQKNYLQTILEFAESQSSPLFIVGGTVRDIILNRQIYDIDFAMQGNAIGFAKNLAKHIDAKAIILDNTQNSARVIYNHGEFYMDFSSIRTNDIIQDLKARDLTINAIAFDFKQLLKSDEVELIDPCNGLNDLNDKIIRFTSAQAIIDDPIRMLRAIRFSATLDFNVPDETQFLIRSSSNLINSSAMERVRDELYKTINIGNSTKYIRLIDNVGLLEKIFPEITKMRGLEQNLYHHLDVWNHSILTLEMFEKNLIPEPMNDHLLEVEEYFNEEIVKGRNRLALLKLSALFHDIAKPYVKSIDENGKIRFFDHHKKGAEMILNLGLRLKLANKESRFMSNIILYHMYPLMLLIKYKRKKVSAQEKSRDIIEFIKNVGENCLGVLLISYADLQATQGHLRTDEDMIVMNDLVKEISNTYFIQMKDSIPLLLTGNDLIKEFGLEPGPIIGKMLRHIREAQLNKEIN